MALLFEFHSTLKRKNERKMYKIMTRMQSKDNKNLEIPFKNENEMKNQTFLQYKFD